MLEVVNLSKVFHTGGSDTTNGEKVAVKNVNFSLEEGEFVTIIGSNGAGKSTLLNIIAGVYYPDAGVMRLDGVDISRVPEYKRARFMARVFQNPGHGTAGSMTIEENLAMAMKRGKRRGLSRGVVSADRKLFREYLALLGLGLEKRLSDPVHLLSGGQRQALTLLMAAMTRPKLLLLDEHTASLDPKTAEQILNLTCRIVKENNLTALMVTHNLRHALDVGTRTFMMHEGEVILDVSGKERKGMTVEDLLDQFAKVRGEQLVEDRLLLA
ncbi:MAG TPA: ABC transporter ATP-binding protein [Firmicutes bacterium]|nr:ABC transporter ATP-binding protein [Bacillota bacterium]HHY98063.1 ABC transporter ATP-binding protein [Bacillota bacterium]